MEVSGGLNGKKSKEIEEEEETVLFSSPVQREVTAQLCNLKYKCATSLTILLVLLLEAIVRRIEEALKND